jgi:hypothetical protein
VKVDVRCERALEAREIPRGERVDELFGDVDGRARHGDLWIMRVRWSRRNGLTVPLGDDSKWCVPVAVDDCHEAVLPDEPLDERAGDAVVVEGVHASR